MAHTPFHKGRGGPRYTPPTNRGKSTPTSTFIGGGGAFARGPQGQAVDIRKAGSYRGLGTSLPLDPLLLEMGFTTAEEQQQALAWMMSQGWNYNDLVRSQTTSSAPLVGGGGGGGSRASTGGGGGGGPPPMPADIVFDTLDYQVPGAPAWWKALKPSEWTPGSEYLTLSNLMIPFLSPEDQRSTATNLFMSDPKNFGHFDPSMLDIQVPVDISNETRNRYTNATRANQALTALSGLAGALGKNPAEDFGPGYNFLRSLASAAGRYGGAGGQPTRTEQLAMRGELDPLLAQTQGQQLGAYGPLARSLVEPFFSAGMLLPTSRDRAGNVSLGIPNPRLY